ncbi:hypothetical protein [Roseateles terrae]|uniref:Glycosyltransferase RgtA/B/C/D-like domain-containing protein n=1 Tax=Roseateles terrae TaxID=431060 RepID=A0ABR6GSY3_9BURK|nr:hypothetical protein [Roseateles terrae]MBB3194354.1 hypothetical protein [Roseateles terrae]OWQ88189.1 hypothetical protein CDN98_08660 [Roseateles terrae]
MALAVWMVVVAAHVPFVLADADASLGFSRGPWTDEGLYTAQVRNALQTGTLDLTESDGVIKEPLYALLAYGVLGGIGDSMTVMRLTMLGLSTLILAWVASGRALLSRAVLLGLPVLALSYYPFHYAHLALVEVTASFLILAALSAVHQRLCGAGRWTWGVSALLIFVAYGMKVQFVYAAVIPPLAFGVAWLLNAGAWRKTWRSALMDVTGSGAAAAVMAGVFAAAWYVPNRALMSFVLGSQSSRGSSSITQVMHSIAANTRELLMDRRLWGVWLLVVVGLVAAAVARRAVRIHPEQQRQWAALIGPPTAWVLIELHKLTLSYLPSRYVLSLVMALGLLGACGLLAAWHWVERGPDRAARHATLSWRHGVIAALVVVLGLDMRDYAKAMERRTYVIRDTQQRLAAEGRWNGQLVIGPWTSTLFWGSGALTKPVWKGYFNDGETLRRLQPVAIASEPDEADSEGAYQAAGLSLAQPPTWSVTVRDWTVNLHPPAQTQRVK